MFYLYYQAKQRGFEIGLRKSYERCDKNRRAIYRRCHLLHK